MLLKSTILAIFYVNCVKMPAIVELVLLFLTKAKKKHLKLFTCIFKMIIQYVRRLYRMNPRVLQNLLGSYLYVIVFCFLCNKDVTEGMIKQECNSLLTE